jgi:hypothetical protein
VNFRPKIPLQNHLDSLMVRRKALCECLCRKEWFAVEALDYGIRKVGNGSLPPLMTSNRKTPSLKRGHQCLPVSILTVPSVRTVANARCIALYLFPCGNWNLLACLCSCRSIDDLKRQCDFSRSSDVKACTGCPTHWHLILRLWPGLRMAAVLTGDSYKTTG